MMAGVAPWRQGCHCVTLLLLGHTLDLAPLLVYSSPCSLLQAILRSQPHTARSTEKASDVE